MNILQHFLAKTLFSVVVSIVAIIHIAGIVNLDAVGLGLVALAVVPWVSQWLESLKVGDFEARFKDLQETLDETREELVELKSMYQSLDDDFLALSNEFDDKSSASDLQKLASQLKAKAKGLGSIDFLVESLGSDAKQSFVFAVACALQVRPQFHAVDNLMACLNGLCKYDDLNGFRLITVYRLVIAVDELIKLNNRANESLFSDKQLSSLSKVLTRISEHPRCMNDDVAKKAKGLLKKL